MIKIQWILLHKLYFKSITKREFVAHSKWLYLKSIVKIASKIGKNVGMNKRIAVGGHYFKRNEINLIIMDESKFIVCVLLDQSRFDHSI